MVNVGIAAALFVMATLTDIAWSHWTIEVNDGRPARAGVWAILIVLASFVSIEAYFHSPWYVIPLAAGAFVGTWWTTRRKRHAG